MPHPRPRHVYPLFLKRLRFFRVVSVQGARQTGKSFLAREILAREKKGAAYLTFDKIAEKERARRAPDTYLLEHQDHAPVIIDEAQKVPDIFDAIKAHVDVHTRPGQFVLLGSTEFSRELRIRESLTGRLGRVRIFPFNMAESASQPPNPVASFDLVRERPRFERKELLRYLAKGGFPGIFHLHGAEERESLLEDWLRLVLERDLHQFTSIKADSELARRILESLAAFEVPCAGDLAKKLRAPVRRVERHLSLLKLLFVVNELPPHRLGSGKPRFLLCDAGLATHLKAERIRTLATWLILEFASQHAYRGSTGVSCSYYRSARGGIIDLVVETRDREIAAFKLLDEEAVDRRDLEILRAFGSKCVADGYKKVALYALAPVPRKWKDGDVRVIPWESVA